MTTFEISSIVKAGIYIEDAIKELEAIPCKCTNDKQAISCTKCSVLSDLYNIRHDIEVNLNENRYAYK